MNERITCLPVENNTDEVLERIEQTYNTSFPVEERRDFYLIRELIDKKSCFTVYVLLRDDSYVGFITAWELADFVYIEHFAIDESARNDGVGGKALKEFMKVNNRAVVLEVEMPNDEMSRRRVGFYERLGYVLDDHIYFQPPYRVGDSWFEMRLMTYGMTHMHDRFDEIKTFIYTEVYGIK
ncbi:GNAT family N-acetyltransferase [Parabacteroides sp. PF5-9]|uniref:GNAT family N-acetyltransferase n=1 Tax=Parabacteroides sp. PF5-9 TaxID=1742404 RepID=UPI002475E2A9|nr:GNAT family N-acetyltransferase [Parabacteroides sp. PF5-9]MDH6358100.1 ribosomal protein S18 acetylase RimI-like enzyme [Parabacteroides sp. PF5-9]